MTQKPLAILCLTPWFPKEPDDRQGNYIYHSLLALFRQGVRISVLVAWPWLPSRLSSFFPEKGGAIQVRAFPEFDRIEQVSYLSVPRNYLKPFSNAVCDWVVGRRLEKLLMDGQVDLIHAHTESLAPIAAALGEKLGIPVVVSLHGIETSPRHIATPGQHRRFQRSLNAMARVILVGKPLWDFFGGITGRDEHFRVVANGFHLPPDTTPLQPGPAILRTKPVRLISVSNLNEGKGIDINLQALAGLHRQGYVEWRYEIIGDGHQKCELVRMAEELGISDKVAFLGAKPHKEVFPFLAEADVFILPSYREAFGIAYLEAMAMGLLAVGVRGQGAEAFIRNGENGLLVSPKDVSSLEACLIQILGQPERHADMARRGCEDARRDFTWTAHGRRLLEVYGEVLQMRDR